MCCKAVSSQNHLLNELIISGSAKTISEYLHHVLVVETSSRSLRVSTLCPYCHATAFLLLHVKPQTPLNSTRETLPQKKHWRA